jgi:hypothetical protein
MDRIGITTRASEKVIELVSAPCAGGGMGLICVVVVEVVEEVLEVVADVVDVIGEPGVRPIGYVNPPVVTNPRLW